MARAALAAVLLAAMALASLRASEAHITAAPDTFDAATSGITALKVSHGCNGTDTTAVVLKVPGKYVRCAVRQRGHLRYARVSLGWQGKM